MIRRDDGIVFDEPSLCCFAEVDTRPRLMAAGLEAHSMVDRTPRSLKVRQPLRRGVMHDIDAARDLLRYAVPRALGRKRIGGVRAMIGVPLDATQAERSAMMTAARDAGLGSIQFIAEPFAAAVGADLPVGKPTATMVVECGAGTTEVAVLSLGGMCLARSVRLGGGSLDRAIADHLHFEHKFLVGDLTAERIKQEYVRLRQTGLEPGLSVEAKGRDIASGVPAALTVTVAELDDVVTRHVRPIVDLICETLSHTPPELSNDLHTSGIVLTGGSALMPRLREMIEEATGLPVAVADHPAHCVANGLHRMLQN
ncbi:rod shape-determining protein [Sphingomonas sp. DBB INV C78]|uniref:rod shape-determining protein n=1 Tax=Sphingomonas sp. DBB INV C78 TaxID=3349434 RepID=UPI0036D267FA